MTTTDLEKSVLERARACLRAAVSPLRPDPSWLAALSCFENDPAQAAEHLSALNEARRYLATQLLCRILLRKQAASPNQTALSASLQQGFSPDFFRRRPGGWRWLRSCDRELGLSSLSAAATGANGELALQRGLAEARSALASGNLPRAEALAEAFPRLAKAELSSLFCEIASHAPPGPEADRLWARAVKAARQSPMIQHGAEESEALAEVYRRLSLTLPASHSAVQAAQKALLQLGKVRAPKDARSIGISRAALAAARAVSRDWLELAETLISLLHGHPAWAPRLMLAKGWRALGEASLEARALDGIQDPLWLAEPLLRALYPDSMEILIRTWTQTEGSFTRLRLLRAAGADWRPALERAVQSECVYYRGAERAFGELIALADAESPREPWTDNPRSELEHEAYKLLSSRVKQPAYAFAMAGESLAWTVPDRGRDWYRMALRAGLSGLELDPSERLIAKDIEFRALIREQAAREPQSPERTELLASLADQALAEDRADEAIDHFNLLMTEAREEKKARWQPYSEMGDRSRWQPLGRLAPALAPAGLAPIAFAPSREALKGKKPADRVELWWQAAEAHLEAGRSLIPEELEALRAVIEKSKGSRWKAQLRAWRLLQIDLARRDPDRALSDAHALEANSNHRVGLVLSLRQIAELLLRSPELSSLVRLRTLFETLARCRSSWAGLEFVERLPDLVMLAPKEAWPELRKLLKSLAGGGACGLALSGLAAAREGALDAAEADFVGSISQSSAGMIELLGSALILASPYMPHKVSFLTDQLTAALDRARGEVYQHCMLVERIARRACAQKISVLPLIEALEKSKIPDEAKDQLQRSLMVIVARDSGSALNELSALWQETPKNRDRALEQIEALAEVHARLGDSHLAESLRRLIREPEPRDAPDPEGPTAETQ